MNDSPAGHGYQPVDALARSLFGFALIAWLPLLVTAVLLWFAPSTAESYAPLKRALDLAFAAATALGLLALIGLYRLDSPFSMRISSRIVSIFRGRWLCLILAFALVEGNILAQIMTRDIAPAVTDPAKFLLFCWSLIFGGLLATIHWQAMQRAYHRLRERLAIAGIVIAALCLIAILVLVSSRLVVSSGLHDRLRGRLDYRPLHFVEDSNAPTAQAFWSEQAQTRVRWLPYSYWVVAPIAGDFINVDERGVRRTPAVTDDPSAPRIFFFGGSTLWGEGARDAYTIPSQVAKLLAEKNRPVTAQNYGQTGYVSTQDLILFQRQLAAGNIPELAVFYQGFNDIFSAFRQSRAGIPMQESVRLSDAEAGRLLRQGQPILRPLSAGIPVDDWSLVTAEAASADAIVDAWLANHRLIRASAAAFDVTALFVWQPALFAKGPRTDFEAQVAAKLENDLPGFQALYREADQYLSEQVAALALDDVIILTDLFSENDEAIFYDRVHINEIGNRHVAEALVPAIIQRLAPELTQP